jgi:hypothetical protein
MVIPYIIQCYEHNQKIVKVVYVSFKITVFLVYSENGGIKLLQSVNEKWQQQSVIFQKTVIFITNSVKTSSQTTVIFFSCEYKVTCWKGDVGYKWGCLHSLSFLAWRADSIMWSPTWKSRSSSASQEILSILCKSKRHCSVHNSPPPVCVSTQINEVHALPLKLFKIILILPSHLNVGLSSGLSRSSFTFTHQKSFWTISHVQNYSRSK